MLNDQGYIAECTGDNIFIVSKGKVVTPPTSAGALKGITREVVINIAEELAIPLVEADMTRYDLWAADECFLTGTAAEVIPVVEVDGRSIGDGKPGALTARFIESFRKCVSSDGMMLEEGD